MRARAEVVTSVMIFMEELPEWMPSNDGGAKAMNRNFPDS
jgi:hypothetical protein